jgi:acylphosphatase
VEVLACGEADTVMRFIEWLWEGSAASRVETVEISDHDPPPPPGFHTA